MPRVDVDVKQRRECFWHSRLRKCGIIRPLNSYSCSPPGVALVSAPSVVFLCEPFLPEGLADVSAEDSVLVGFSAVVDFFELFVLDGLPVVSAGDSPVVPCIISSPLWRGETGVAPGFAFPPGGDASRVAPRAAFDDAVALGVAEAVADALAVGGALAEAVADGDTLIPADAPGEA